MSQPAVDAANEALADLRISLDGEQNGATSPKGSASPPPTQMNGVNGHASHESPRHSRELSGEDRYERIQRELERTREEKETLATQYRNLVAKLNTMRTTLGTKLKQDAEELDRREQLVQQLTTQNEDLTSTIVTLQDEIITSNAEAERASRELETMRSRAMDDSAQESLMRERELRETQAELERCRIERDEWEQAMQTERVALDEAKSNAEGLKRELEMERQAHARIVRELEHEREKTENLQSVLQDFQLAKDHELHQAIKDHETQLNQITTSLAEYKHRAHTAEVQLEESSTNTHRTAELEQEVKEKTLLINKLRHEGVILNEHLMEALRRLRRNATDNNVDRRLVTNVLMSFLATPRGDPKRFEMLGLLGSILSWSDAEREKAGLQRAGLPASGSGGSLWAGKPAHASPKGKGADLEKTDETESFSQMWVEFLLKEASAGSAPAPSSSSPVSPSRSSLSLPRSPPSPGSSKLPRLASFTSAGMASSPNLSLPSASRKGKERSVT
ncbi:hypothetical protein BD410DRAFT_821056 [Rickenella mellea]|uniref:GRIP domain-containing protein n=1 Tax=Rickenella mellea TaxID=50990 RepID=A0A4Y7Q590_9AGAM|nr:hypothetical protein BD410DRAFT_821056 [Rickenella mellea]